MNNIQNNNELPINLNDFDDFIAGHHYSPMKKGTPPSMKLIKNAQGKGYNVGYNDGLSNGQKIGINITQPKAFKEGQDSVHANMHNIFMRKVSPTLGVIAGGAFLGLAMNNPAALAEYSSQLASFVSTNAPEIAAFLGDYISANTAIMAAGTVGSYIAGRTIVPMAVLFATNMINIAHNLAEFLLRQTIKLGLGVVKQLGGELLTLVKQIFLLPFYAAKAGLFTITKAYEYRTLVLSLALAGTLAYYNSTTVMPYVNSAIDMAAEAKDLAIPYINSGIEMATPYVNSAISTATPYVNSGIEAARAYFA